MAGPNESLLPILQDHYNACEHGWLWIAFYDDGADGGVLEQIAGSMTDEASVPEAAESLAFIINGVGAERALLALCRREARPAEVDRELWRGLRTRVSAEKLVDLVVFNDRETWSMRGEDEAAQLAPLG